MDRSHVCRMSTRLPWPPTRCQTLDSSQRIAPGRSTITLAHLAAHASGIPPTADGTGDADGIGGVSPTDLSALSLRRMVGPPGAGTAVRRSRHGLLRPCTSHRVSAAKRRSRCVSDARGPSGFIGSQHAVALRSHACVHRGRHCTAAELHGSTGCIVCDRQRWARLAPHYCGRACSLRPA
jgi:hypothetical protein